MLHPVMVLGAVVRKAYRAGGWPWAHVASASGHGKPCRPLSPSMLSRVRGPVLLCQCETDDLCDVCVRSGGKTAFRAVLSLIHFTLALQNLKSNSNPCMKEKKCCFQVSMCSPQYFFQSVRDQ